MNVLCKIHLMGSTTESWTYFDMSSLGHLWICFFGWQCSLAGHQLRGYFLEFLTSILGNLSQCLNMLAVLVDDDDKPLCVSC